MTSDLKAAMIQVRMYIDDNEGVPWETLNVSVSDITFGGRVTDVWDKRTISSILKKYFQPGVLEDEYRFSGDGIFYAPPEGDITVSILIIFESVFYIFCIFCTFVSLYLYIYL